VGEARTQEDDVTAFEVRAAFHPLIWMLGLGAGLIVLGGGFALAGRIRGGVRTSGFRGVKPAMEMLE